MIVSYVIGFIGVILAAFAQIILKLGATRKSKGSTLSFFVNLYTLTGYGSMFIVTLINLYVFKFLDLKYILVFLASTYILVLVLSYLLLKEPINRKKVIQYTIILGGIIIFNI